MKKTKKRVLGFFGLVLVVVMTVVAAAMPSPGAQATSTVTDTLVVRVVGDTPSVRFGEPASNLTTTENAQIVAIEYENVTDAKIEIEHTGADGIPIALPPYIYTDLDYNPGAVTIPLDLSEYGYGKFVLSAYGKGYEGGLVPLDSVMITYLPVIASAAQDEDDGLVNVSIDSFSDEVDKIEIYLGDDLLGSAERGQFNNIIKISLGERGSGTYTIYIKAYDSEGNELYLPYEVTFDYDTIYVPDTGSFFQGLNISKEDYLITGLIVSFSLGIMAFYIVARGNKNSSKSRRKH